MIVNKYNSICHKQADLELYNVYGQEFYIGEFKKKIMSTIFSGLKREQSFRFMHIYVVSYKIILIL